MEQQDKLCATCRWITRNNMGEGSCELTVTTGHRTPKHAEVMPRAYCKGPGSGKYRLMVDDDFGCVRWQSLTQEVSPWTA